ncbi:MAG: hypothetical protein KJT03_18205, partial [Verrucomicrobiae bacterium]|nr:hypothetical protein [Verrucomicrobiae bacterium]
MNTAARREFDDIAVIPDRGSETACAVRSLVIVSRTGRMARSVLLPEDKRLNETQAANYNRQTRAVRSKAAEASWRPS